MCIFLDIFKYCVCVCDELCSKWLYHPSSIHPSIIFHLSWASSQQGAVWAGSPRLPSHWIHPLTLPGELQSVPRPAEWHRHSSISWIFLGVSFWRGMPRTTRRSSHSAGSSPRGAVAPHPISKGRVQSLFSTMTSSSSNPPVNLLLYPSLTREQHPRYQPFSHQEPWPCTQRCRFSSQLIRTWLPSMCWRSWPEGANKTTSFHTPEAPPPGCSDRHCQTDFSLIM